MKNLVIVESPTKARTIGKFLGQDYEIRASMGHVLDLPKSKLGVDVEHDFKPEFELVADKKKVVDELESLAKNADSIILATDPDREGEAIASHVADILKSTTGSTGTTSTTGSSKVGSPRDTRDTRATCGTLNFKRIVFHEITKEAIEEAFKNPRSLDENLVDAQTARRVLDRLVGYKLSPLLWQKVRRGLSAGRVQSVALRLIVEREKEIEKFAKEQYWTVTVLLCKSSNNDSSVFDERRGTKQNNTQNNVEKTDSVVPRSVPRGSAIPTEFELIEINGKKIEKSESFNLYDGEYKVTKTVIDNEEKSLKIVEDLKTKQFIVSDVIKKETKRSPLPPYTTSTLQQDASRRFGFSGRRTMSLAQKLYEEGFITYHRTDSLNLSTNAVSAIRSYVKKEFGDKYIPSSARLYKTKQKSAQEAHEAIRPTKIQNTESVIQKEMGRDYAKIYGLIWRRAVACQMSDALIESTTVIVDAFQNTQKTQNAGRPENQIIRNSDSSVIPNSFRDLVHEDNEMLKQVQHDKKGNVYRLKTNGSVLVFEGFLKINPQALQDKKLPGFEASEELKAQDVLAEKHETTPPPRYNDASLIKTLEEKEIGRPSTYATIVSTIESRQYIERNEGRFIPTSVGIAVNDFLVENFPEIDDIPFTANMENKLDAIANGEEKWQPMIKEFYEPLSKKLKEAKGSERVKIDVEETNEICGECGAPMVVRIGRFGKFLSCSKFPDCKFSKPYLEDTGLICPKDGGKIIVRKTKKGRKFYGCSNYPACTFAAWKIEDIKKGTS